VELHRAGHPGKCSILARNGAFMRLFTRDKFWGKFTHDPSFYDV
jgi:hypothetical protein